MMGIYLGDDADELDGFEFLTMAEAGELGHWEIVREMSETVGDDAALELAEWAIPIQERHKIFVRESLARAGRRGGRRRLRCASYFVDHRLDAEHDAGGEQRERERRRARRRRPRRRRPGPARVAGPRAADDHEREQRADRRRRRAARPR